MEAILLSAQTTTPRRTLPDMSEVYSNACGSMPLRGRGRGVPLEHGVYIACMGPSYATPANPAFRAGAEQSACPRSRRPSSRPWWAGGAGYLMHHQHGRRCVAAPASARRVMETARASDGSSAMFWRRLSDSDLLVQAARAARERAVAPLLSNFISGRGALEAADGTIVTAATSKMHLRLTMCASGWPCQAVRRAPRIYPNSLVADTA
jgi:hypothetical protein